jgi:ABC-type uncharacterized transport system permease subunit
MTIVLIATALYIAAAALLWRSAASDTGHRRGWIPLAALAVLFHVETHAEAWRLLQGPDMHFFAALSLVGLGMSALTTAFGASGRMPALGIVVFPLAALSLFSYWSYGHAGNASDLGELHAWLALLAYATLGCPQSPQSSCGPRTRPAPARVPRLAAPCRR